jgi:nucleoside-diphosphate-sugar epimerase/predicted dehydrogenase
MKFRSAFVGTGYISEYHLKAIRRLGDQVELVGVFDTDKSKCQHWAKTANTTPYSSLRELREAGAQIIHILTPPQTHAEVAIEALRLGCHVFIEKPLASTTAECDMIIKEVEQSGKTACVSHSLLYDPQIRKALETVRSGKLGRIIGLDILRSSAYPPYAGGVLPPQYRTASYPFQDLGIHACYLFEAFLGPIEDVNGAWASLGGDPDLAFDEWRALVRCRDGIGQFQLSWNTKPLQSQLTIHGTKGVLRVDLFLMSQSLRAALPVPKPVERVINALSDSTSMFFDVPRNALGVLTRRILPYHGLQDLIRAFYYSLESGGPVPVGVREARSAVYWTEDVSREADAEYQEKLRTLSVRNSCLREPGKSVLITGASGSLGRAVSLALQDFGHSVRLLMRRLPAKSPANAEVVVGNLGNPAAVDDAVRGASIVIHAGAAMSGGWPEHECATVAGTKNVLEACLRHKVKKLVYVSSMSVLDWAGAPPSSPLDETSPLEHRADERGSYTRAKLAAERLVSEYASEHHLPVVILRPGKIFGPRQPLLSSAIGWKVRGRWIMLGDGDVGIPFVYLDDVADAVVAAMQSEVSAGEVIQISDPVQLTQNDALRLWEGEKVRVLHIPRWIVYALASFSQLLFRLINRESPVGIYRMRSAMAKRRFQSSKADLIGWKPALGVMEGIKRELKRRQERPVDTLLTKSSENTLETVESPAPQVS